MPMPAACNASIAARAPIPYSAFVYVLIIKCFSYHNSHPMMETKQLHHATTSNFTKQSRTGIKASAGPGSASYCVWPIVAALPPPMTVIIAWGPSGLKPGSVPGDGFPHHFISLMTRRSSASATTLAGGIAFQPHRTLPVTQSRG